MSKADQAKKARVWMGWRRLCGVVLVVVAVLVGEGEEARGGEGRPGISRFNVGQDFFNLGVEGFGGVGCRGKVHHQQS